MKYIFRIVLSVWIWCPVWAHAGKAEKNVTYLPVIEVQDKEVRKENRNVALSMSVDLSRARIRTQHTVALTPVLVSPRWWWTAAPATGFTCALSA